MRVKIVTSGPDHQSHAFVVSGIFSRVNTKLHYSFLVYPGVGKLPLVSVMPFGDHSILRTPRKCHMFFSNIQLLPHFFKYISLFHHVI